MFERKKHPVISKQAFVSRLVGQVLIVVVLLVASLFVGMVGFRVLEGYSWVDSFLNASMLLGGMGQINPVTTSAGKIFAGLYSLYSGFFMMLCGGLLLAPVFHRILHHFHAE